MMADAPATPKETAEQRKSREKWETEDDLRTLARAEEIRKDKARFARAKKAAQEQLDNLKKAMQ